jgi:hypothetical protein
MGIKLGCEILVGRTYLWEKHEHENGEIQCVFYCQGGGKNS